jgi:hypothetical protein
MRFTEHEMTTALTSTAKTVLAAQNKDVRKGRVDIDEAWDGMTRFQRYQVLDALGTQILPVLVALPDVAVAPGTKPTFTTEQVVDAVEAVAGETGGSKMRRRTEVVARIALVKTALDHLPIRNDPDALTVPDHL